jgi:hypothetical protein
LSPSARHALHEALLWEAVALGGFIIFYFFDDSGARSILALSAASPR